MRRICVVGVIACVTLAFTVGCGRKVKEAVEAARVAQDAKDGDFTVKNDKGETVKVEGKAEGDKSGNVKITTDKGTFQSEVGAGKVTEKDIGVAFYPGAKVGTGATVTGSGETNGKMSTVQLTTPDPIDKVTAFYKGKYAKGNTVVEQPDSLMINIASGEGQGKIIMVGPDKETGGVQIVIQSSAMK